MSNRYLEISYRHGKPFAAYLALPRLPDDRCVRSEPFGETIVIDYAGDGRAIGLEIIHPQLITEADVNAALARVNQPPLPAEDFAPLRAA